MRLLACSAVLLALVGAPAMAATVSPYTEAAFASAQKQGAPVLVWVHADWCPTCAAQKPILERIEAEPKYKDLEVFVVDFDSQKDVVRALGVQMQSTLIAFDGGKERARSTGQTSEAAIRAVLAKTES